MGSIWSAVLAAWRAALSEPSLPSSLLLSTALVAIVAVALVAAVFGSAGGGGGARPATCAGRLFDTYVRCGRMRNLLCSPCDRAGKRYPLANTCQVPHFRSLSDIYTFVFGYKTGGLFVEVGAFDGESFSNTSGLADLGWRGHYLEPIPAYADACRARHAANPKVTVHTVCAGEKDGEAVELSAAGPFSSAVDDEIESVANSKLSTVLSALGWNPGSTGGAAPAKIKTTTVALNTFFKGQGIAAGEVDVMVVDVEGFEWPIFKGFDIARWKPKLVIVEIQEKQARYRSNERAQADAIHIERYFASAGYSILYRDVINTIFVHKEVDCLGGD